MSNYTETVTITAPAALADIAARIARALDPDVGGAGSFRPAPGGETISATTPCTPEFKARVLMLKDSPQMLHAVVAADYVARWPELTPPTLVECEAFCDGMIFPEAAP